MVEGHQCHRVAAAHRKLLVGRSFKATSPNQRFTAGAAAINNRPLAKIEVHGKNLFYFFRRLSTGPVTGAAATGAAAATAQHDVVHVHFGMSGAFKTMRRPGDEPTPTTRLRLEHEELDLVAHVSAMTVNHGDDAYYACAPRQRCVRVTGLLDVQWVLCGVLGSSRCRLRSVASDKALAQTGRALLQATHQIFRRRFWLAFIKAADGQRLHILRATHSDVQSC